MKETPVTEKVARSFLLGEVDPALRQRIESLFLTDSEARETILIAEDSLLEDYLEGTLASAEAERFLERFAANLKERKRLRITQSIREYAIENAPPISEPISVPEKLRLLLPGWAANQRVGLPVLASIIIVLIIGAVWFMLRMNQRVREDNQQASIERQLAEVNSPASLSASPPQIFSTTLPAISVRSVQSSSAIILQSSTRLVELHLLWGPKEEYPTYQAELGRVESKAFMFPPLHLEEGQGVRLVRLRIPADLLTAGLYRIRLRGMASDNSPGPTEEYDFQVIRR
jgi:hypothetical protein